MLLSHISRLGLGIKQTPATSGVPVFTGDIWGHLATMKEVFIAFDFTMADFLESKYEWESVGQ